MKILIVALAALSAYACDDEDEGVKRTDEPASAPALSQTTTKAKAEPAKPAPEAKKAAAEGEPASDCPAGKWRYDFGDAFMRSFVAANMKNAKLVKTEGSYICEFPAGSKGEASCRAVGGPVVNDVEVDQGGMKMTMHTEVHGSSKMQVEIQAGKIKVLSSDLSQLQMKAHGTVAGQKIDFPLNDIAAVVPAGESQMAYKCEGDTLKLLVEAEGVTTDWQALQRVK